MAIGWKLLSAFGVAFGVKSVFTAYNSVYYGPILSAFMRKHSKLARRDPFEITDRKREYYEIDTSQYMNYTSEELGH